MKDNPYVGPRPYERADRHNFFGRSREGRDLVSLILAERVVLFYAKSGAGKTSLLNAVVIPALEEEGFDVLPVVRVGQAIPYGVEPAAVENVFVLSALVGLAGEAADPAALLGQTLSAAVAAHTADETEDLLWGARAPLLIVDQFEELFTAHRDRWQEARGFFQQLAAALDAQPRLGVVLTIREDYVAELEPYAAELPNRLRARFWMDRLGVEEALEAVTRPAANAGCPFAPGVAERLVDDLRRIKQQRIAGQEEAGDALLGPVVEPVQLQVVCSRLWAGMPEQDDYTITWQEVAQYGDVDRALADFYERGLAAARDEVQAEERELRAWFSEQLITPLGTRGLVVREADETAGLSNQAVDVLEGRLLLHSELRAGARWYELAHDRLIDPVLASNRAWEAARETPLRKAARQWKETGDRSLLYRDRALVQARAWARERPGEVEPYEREFLQASRRGQRLRVALRVGLPLGLLLVLFLAWTAARGALAAYSRQMAAQALYLWPIDQLQSVQAAREGVVLADASELLRFVRPLLGRVDTSQAEIVLGQTMADFYLSHVLDQPHDQVNSIVYSADGRYLYAAIHAAEVEGEMRGILVWDVTAGGEPRNIGGPRAAYDLALSPDGRFLAVGGNDSDGRGQVGIWDVERGEWRQWIQAVTPEGIYDEVYAVAFSPDGRYLATGGDYGGESRNLNSGTDGGMVRLWAVSTASDGILQVDASALDFADPTGRVQDIAFGPDGRYLAAASDDGLVRIWDVGTANGLRGTPPPPTTLGGHTAAVGAVAFSPDGAWLASGSADHTIRVWDTARWEGIMTLVGHTEAVTSLAFETAGTRLVSGSRDRTVRIWDIAARNPNPVTTLTGPASLVHAVAFSPDGSSIAAGSGDNRVRIWNLDFPYKAGVFSMLSGHTARVRGIAFSPDSACLASGDNDGWAHVWSVESGQIVQSLSRLDRQVWAVAYSPDGQYMVTCSDAIARVWNAADGTRVQELIGHESNVQAAAFHPDGRFLVTGSGDQTALVWETESWQSVAVLSRGGWPGPVYDVDFSPDGRLVALAHGLHNRDSAVRLWELVAQPDGRLEATLAMTLTGHTNMIFGVDFSPNNDYLASASWDGTVAIWDLDSGERVSRLEHPGYVYDVAFSPDGRYLATGARDGGLRIWDVSALPRRSPRLVTAISSHTDLIWSVAYSPDGRYLASGSWDGTLRRYRVQFDRETIDSIWSLVAPAIEGQTPELGEPNPSP
ncbi:MAG: WD40 repeat domain-containing protein [Anaerolineae bacterium]|nr:WD40 repeat domain-containing protein [Anaerolineae bacterium]